jgi:hypothetical protein
METSPRHSPHFPSIFQLLLSSLGILICGLAALILVAGGLFSFTATSERDNADFLFSIAWIMLLVFALLVPSIVYAVARLSGHPLSAIKIKNRYLIAVAGMVIWPFILVLGNDLSASPTASIFLPFLQLFAIGLPLWWLLETAQRGLSTGSPQRTWGMASFSLLISPLAALIVELIAMVAMAFIAFVFINAQQPQLIDQIGNLISQYQNGLEPSMTDQLSRELLAQPGTIFFLMVLFSGVAPMVEELIKPLALWVIASRKPTPAQGFACGLICGAAFALLESLGIASSSTGAVWLLNMLQRSGTGLLHITTCGLMGWGLASAWSEQKYLRTALAFFSAVLLHGVWNTFGLLMGFIPFLGPTISAQLPVAAWMSQAAPIVLGILAIIAFSILLGLNRRLRQEQSSTLPPPENGGIIEPATPPAAPLLP